MNKSIIWIGIGAVALWYFFKIRSLTNLNFVARNLGYSGGKLMLTLGVQNPTGSDLTLNSFFGNVLVDGYAVGNIASNQVQQQIVKGNSETPLTVSITPDMFGTTALLINQLNNGTPSQQHVQLSGQANVNGHLVPVNLQFT